MCAMDLRFSLPETNEAAVTETRAAELKRWLTNLPVLNTAETSQMLFKALTALNRTEVNDSLRIKLLELYRQPIRSVCNESQKLYIGLPLPLPEKNKLVVERVRQFQNEMGIGYKRLVLHATHKPKLGGVDKEELAIAIQRAIYYLTQVLAKSFELYAPSPEGTWHEIHQLYRYAEIEGLTETPVADDLNATLPKSSVGHVYKQALLLDFCDPYHLPARMLEKIRRYLDRWAPEAKLSMALASLRPDCQFLINLATDRAGVANIESQPITTEAQYRLLTTVDLARVMHQQLSALQIGSSPDPDGLEKDFFVNQGQEMLMRLITSWGVNPKRYFTRNATHGAQLNVATGIDAINFFVHGAVEFACSTSEVGPQPRRNQISGVQEAPQHSGLKWQSVPWDLQDESAGGFALRKSNAHLEQVRVGDLIATRAPQQHAHWSISVVRWVRSAGPGDIEFGAQRLAPSADAIAILPADTENGEFKMALLLPEVKALRQATTLITPRGMFGPGRQLILDNGYRTHQIRSTRLINVTGSFEQFQFAMDT
jgi:hypothetical protein